MNFITLCLIATPFVILIVYISKKIRNIVVLRNVPAPKSIPIIGWTITLARHNEVSLFEETRKLANDFKGIYRLSFLHHDVINIYNADDIEQIISSYEHINKSDLYNILRNWLGNGLLTSSGEKWRKSRKLLTPAFHFQILQEFLKCFNDETDKFVKDIEENIDECARDIKPFIVYFTMKNICETAMGLDKIDEDTFLNYREKIKNLMSLYFQKLQRLWYRSSILYNLSDMASRERHLIRDLHKFSYEVIEDRLKTRKNSLLKRRKMAMLDLLLKFKEDGVDIDLKSIREEVDTFVFEGHDTTSAAIMFLLLVLANNPDVQEKAAKEIENVFNHEYRHCTQEDLSKLEYLECCIKETLRLFPSVPFISRACGEEYTTTTGYTIPKGTTLHLHIFDLHRDPKVFPDPQKFDPDRFKPENVTTRSPFAHVPFSAGPRNCIGQRFAMWELKTVLCGILRKFKLETIDKTEDMIFRCNMILSTVNPIRIKFVKKYVDVLVIQIEYNIPYNYKE